jgi:soluble lytic murein transglycosylase-like protein
MNLRHLFAFFCIAAVVSISVRDLPGQGFYSYIDENGVQVFTNIPPVQIEDSSDSISPEKNIPESSNSHAYDSIINKYASYYQLDPSLIQSIIATESGFNPNAVSSKGARGLMQLMPETANRLGVKDSFDPEQNIHAGIRHLRSLMDTFNNNLDLSLAAYNAGENLVLRLGRIPSYKETIDYVQSVISRYRERLANTLDPIDSPNSLTFRYFDDAGVLHVTNIPPNN